MATVGESLWTLADWAKMMDPDGKVAKLVDLASHNNDLFLDAKFAEGNLPTGHQSTCITGLPTVTWRKLNRGVQPSKFSTVQVVDTCGMATILSKADKNIVELNGGTAQARQKQEKPFITALREDVTSGFFYYDTDTDPEKFLGLAARYPYSDASNVVNAGGSGSDVTSIWLVVWGPDTVEFIFPKGSKAGIDIIDIGKGEPIMVDDSETTVGQYLAYCNWYEWKIGLAVYNWKYVVRICNIETSGTDNTFNHDHLIEAFNKIPDIGAGKPAIYCNKTIKTQMDKAATDSQNRMFTQVKDAFGRPVTEFFGIPIRKCDLILDTETALTATP